MADLNQMIAHLKAVLALPSSIDDGTTGSHGSILGTGDTFNYLTSPKTPEVDDGGQGSGSIKFPYDCRERHKHYIGQQETGTTDNHFSGVVTATYDFSFSGKVFISNINNQGKRGNSGNCIESHLQSINGSNVG